MTIIIFNAKTGRKRVSREVINDLAEDAEPHWADPKPDLPLTRMLGYMLVCFAVILAALLGIHYAVPEPQVAQAAPAPPASQAEWRAPHAHTAAKR